jgi:hypothetical protein
MMAKRERAPGGGRKRLAPSVAQNLTIRIDADLRGRLEASATKRAERKRNWNLSQEILLRLRCSLDKEREHRRNSATRALCDLISDMAKRELHTDLPEQQSWHRDPFTFRAFKVAVAKLLEELEPSGEMRAPRTLASVFQPYGPLDDPEMLGEYAATKELVALRQASPRWRTETAVFLRVGVREGGLRADGSEYEYDYESPLTTDEFEEQLHAWPRIRHALGIEEPTEDKS